MSEQPLQPVYLISGTDRGKVVRAVRRLAARVEAEGGAVERYEIAEGSDEGPAAIVGACMALGLFAGPRLILVEGVEAWKAGQIQGELERYVAEPTEGTVLALVAGPKLRADSRLRKLVPESGRLVYDAPTAKELPAFVAGHAQALGARFEPHAARRLIEIVGERPEQLEAEVDKLASYAAGETIDEQLVDELVFRFDAKDAPPWDLLDAVSARDRTRVFRELGRLYDTGRDTAALVPLLAGHVDLLRRVRAAADRGESPRAFASATGLHEYRVRKAFELSSRWSAADAARATVLLAQADHDAKGNSRLDAGFVLERSLAEAL